MHNSGGMIGNSSLYGDNIDKNKDSLNYQSRRPENILQGLGHEALMEFNENIKILNNILHSPKSRSASRSPQSGRYYSSQSPPIDRLRDDSSGIASFDR